MQGKDRLFLSTSDAIEAVSAAFSQYSLPFSLITNIWPLVFGGDTYVMRESNRQRYWAKTAGHAKLVSAGEADLKRLMIDRLRHAPPSLERLALICRQVFGAPAHAIVEPSTTGAPGLWIDTAMAGFACIRCGHCCRTLNYRDGCSLEDYQVWIRSGRDDILAWVGTVKRNGAVFACRIWMTPGTNRFADRCPWLKQADPSGRFECTIYDVRPSICRQYPGTRKHARMTGCRGV